MLCVCVCVCGTESASVNAMCSTVCCTVHTVLYCTVLYCTVLYCTVVLCSTLHPVAMTLNWIYPILLFSFTWIVRSHFIRCDDHIVNASHIISLLYGRTTLEFYILTIVTAVIQTHRGEDWDKYNILGTSCVMRYCICCGVSSCYLNSDRQLHRHRGWLVPCIGN